MTLALERNQGLEVSAAGVIVICYQWQHRIMRIRIMSPVQEINPMVRGWWV